MNKYYKLVTPELKSICSISENTQALAIQYRVDEYVFANNPGSFLFVFKSFDDARKFKNEYSAYNNCLLYECEVTGIDTQNLTKDITGNIRYWPDGTIHVYGIKLIKEAIDISLPIKEGDLFHLTSKDKSSNAEFYIKFLSDYVVIEISKPDGKISNNYGLHRCQTIGQFEAACPLYDIRKVDNINWN